MHVIFFKKFLMQLCFSKDIDTLKCISITFFTLKLFQNGSHYMIALASAFSVCLWAQGTVFCFYFSRISMDTDAYCLFCIDTNMYRFSVTMSISLVCAHVLIFEDWFVGEICFVIFSGILSSVFPLLDIKSVCVQSCLSM